VKTRIMAGQDNCEFLIVNCEFPASMRVFTHRNLATKKTSFYYFFGYRNGADLLPLVAIAPFYSFGTYKLPTAYNPRKLILKYFTESTN
jgi:hypothetical protein